MTVLRSWATLTDYPPAAASPLLRGDKILPSRTGGLWAVTVGNRSDMAGSSADRGEVLWRQLVRAQGVVLPRLHKALRRRHRLSLTELVVLQALVEAAAGEATMTYLQQAAHLSAAGTTRVVTTLELRGLVSRARKGQDRRLLYVHATEQGAMVTSQAQLTVDELMRGLLRDGMTAADIAVAASVLASLVGESGDDEP